MSSNRNTEPFFEGDIGGVLNPSPEWLAEHSEAKPATKSPSPDSEAGRGRAEREAYRATGCRRHGIMAACQGNRWMMENARAVGNLPPGC